MGNQGGPIIINNGPVATAGHLHQGQGCGHGGIASASMIDLLRNPSLKRIRANFELLQQYGSRFGPTLTGGGCFQYPGGQRLLCPPQGPMWNGQQWVTNGPTKAEHKAAMKDKADTRPQELVPADPDISRMYEVQELDGNWTRRSRYTIDSKDIGQVRWYQRPDGTFFAKRLPSG